MKRVTARLLARVSLVTVGIVLLFSGPGPVAAQATFALGDLFISYERGPVDWRDSTGALKTVLVSTVPGYGEGMRFDAAANLYVAHWCPTVYCGVSGFKGAVEKFNNAGASQGAVGSSAFDCNPHAIAFDAVGNMYVGQADCTGNVLKFSGGVLVASYPVVAERRGSFWIELAPDGCTLFYTSWGPNVKRYNVCTQMQLADFNRAPLPGGQTQALRVLPDGGVLVSSGAVIARLDATGNLTQTYNVPTGEAQYWAGLDLVGDGTFWAANYYASVLYAANIFRFDLTTGQIRGSFNTNSTPSTVVDIRVFH